MITGHVRTLPPSSKGNKLFFEIFFSMSKFIAKENYQDLKVRGLKIADSDAQSNLQFVEGEFLCASEQGILSFAKFLQHLQNKKVIFIRLHLSGDKHLKPCDDINVSHEGCMAVANLFYSGLLQNLVEFRFTNFVLDPFAVLSMTDVLIMNPSLLLVDFSRNNINEDIAGGII